jgi:Tfp pilus assembly protein PilV
MQHDATARGFSLLEALIAAALFAGAIGVLAHLVIRSVDQSLRAEQKTAALVLAQAKLEQLRGVPFAYDDGGARVDHPDLAVSPDDSLTSNAPPYVEMLDRFGEFVAPGTSASYVRRWSITSSGDAPDTLTIAVCVNASREGVDAGPSCVWSMRTRQP